jgi:hypothetical protein
MGGWPASDNFQHFPSKLLIVSLQLSIQKCADADRGDDDASAECTTLQHDIHVFTSSCPWDSNQADGASCLVATDTQNHLAPCKGEGLWGHLNFLGFGSNLDHKMTIRLLELWLQGDNLSGLGSWQIGLTMGDNRRTHSKGLKIRWRSGGLQCQCSELLCTLLPIAHYLSSKYVTLSAVIVPTLQGSAMECIRAGPPAAIKWLPGYWLYFGWSTDQFN